MGELYIDSLGFQDFSPKELICIFSCFTNIKVDDTLKTYTCSNFKLESISKKIGEIFEKYDIIQVENYIPNDTENNLHLDLINYINDWCEADSEEKCKEIINRVKIEKNIFLGDFIKAIIKINNIGAELEKICHIMNNMELKKKLSQIGSLTLKFVATNQSLYI